MGESEKRHYNWEDEKRCFVEQPWGDEACTDEETGGVDSAWNSDISIARCNCASGEVRAGSRHT